LLILGNSLKSGNWAWTGFGEYTTKRAIEKTSGSSTIKTTEEIQSRKTLWDGLQLAGTVAIPVVLAVGGFWFNRREQRRAEKLEEQEQIRVDTNLREAALQAYIDRISELLTDKELGKRTLKDNPARDVARVRTLTVLRSLGEDGQRKEAILRFLGEAQLISTRVPNYQPSRG
jgi:hypothetical protein